MNYTIHSLMRKEFEMSMFGEIKSFVGLQVHKMKDTIHITNSKYINNIPKTFGMEDFRIMNLVM